MLPEDGIGADRALDHLEVGAGRRRAVGQRPVMAAIEVTALQDVIGEEPQLPHGAPALSVKPCLGKPGFLAADLGDRLGARLGLVGDGVQEGRALGAGE